MIVNFIELPYLITAIIMVIAFQGKYILLDKLYIISFYVAMFIIILDFASTTIYRRCRDYINNNIGSFKIDRVIMEDSENEEDSE